MKREEAKLYVKSKLQDYLRLEVPPLMRSEGLECEDDFLCRNFLCLNIHHNEKIPSMRYDYARNKIHCFGCGVDWDIFDLIGNQYDLKNFSDQFQKVLEIFEIDMLAESGTLTPKKFALLEKKPPLRRGYPSLNKFSYKEICFRTKQYYALNWNCRDYIERCHQSVHETNYFEARGIGKNLVEKYQLGYDHTFFTRNEKKKSMTVWSAIIIPTSHNSFTARNTHPDCSRENRYRKFGRAVPFNISVLESSCQNPIFIVEGEIDALSVMSLGFNAIAVGGFHAVSYNILKKLTRYASTVDTVFLIFAPDAGISMEHLKSYHNNFELRKIRYSIASPNIYGTGEKDANEALLKDKEAFRKRLKLEVEKILLKKN